MQSLDINGSYVKREPGKESTLEVMEDCSLRKSIRPAELGVEAWEAQILLIQLY